jgi:hypothetical protein
VIALLNFAGDGDSIERKGELCGHPLTSGKYRVDSQYMPQNQLGKSKSSESKSGMATIRHYAEPGIMTNRCHAPISTSRL